MKKVIRILIILVIIAAAIIGYSLYKKSKNKPEWRLDNVTTGSIREEVTASGSLNPSSKVEVGTEISGKIAKLFKDYNSTVKKGDILAKLDTENLETALESSQADVRRSQLSADDAKVDMDLQKELNNKGMSTSYDYQKAKNKYDQAVQSLANAHYSLKRAEKNLNNAIITSPIDGVIISRNVEEGQTVAASMSSPILFIIANNLRQMQINADIDEADIGKIKVGLPVEFTVDAYADESFEGKVNQVRLSPSTTQNVVTYSVIIDVDNPQMKLLPGMTANVTIIVREKEDVLRIPESALRFKPSKELWKLFGLKWDDKFSSRSGRRFGSGQSTGMTNKASGQAQQGASVQGKSKQWGNQKSIPESLRVKFAKMSPEQKAAFKEKMKKQGGRPDFARMTPEQKAAFKKKSAQGNFQTEVSQSTDTKFSFAADNSAAEKQNKGRIWVLVNGKPTQIEVVTGLSDGNYAEVISGVKEEQELIIGVNYKNAKQAAKTSTILGGGGGMGPR